jgi:hypothetical protein
MQPPHAPAVRGGAAGTQPKEQRLNAACGGPFAAILARRAVAHTNENMHKKQSPISTPDAIIASAVSMGAVPRAVRRESWRFTW